MLQKPKIIRQTIFQVRDGKEYTIDVDETTEIRELKKILSHAAHLRKNSFNIYHNNIDYTKNYDDNTLLQLFPNEQKIYFTLICSNNLENLEEDISIQIDIFLPCNEHPEKFQIFYCYDCHKSICKFCLDLKHKNHNVKEKNDYLAPTQLLVGKIFQDAYYYIADENYDQSKFALELQNKINNELLTQLNRMIEQIFYNLNDLLKYFINKVSLTKNNINENINLLKNYSIYAYKALKNDINTNHIIINDNIFLTLDKKIKEIIQNKENLKQNSLKFIEINKNFENIKNLVEYIYHGLFKSFEPLLSNDKMIEIKKNIDKSVVNKIQRDDIMKKMFENIEGDPKRIFRSGERYYNTTSNKNYQPNNEIKKMKEISAFNLMNNNNNKDYQTDLNIHNNTMHNIIGTNINTSNDSNINFKNIVIENSKFINNQSNYNNINDYNKNNQYNQCNQYTIDNTTESYSNNNTNQSEKNNYNTNKISENYIQSINNMNQTNNEIKSKTMNFSDSGNSYNSGNDNLLNSNEIISSNNYFNSNLNNYSGNETQKIKTTINTTTKNVKEINFSNEKNIQKKNNPSIYNKLLNNINDGLKQKELENQNLKIKKTEGNSNINVDNFIKVYYPKPLTNRIIIGTSDKNTSKGIQIEKVIELPMNLSKFLIGNGFCNYNNDLFISGGFYDANNKNYLSNNFIIYDSKEKIIKTLPEMKIPKANHSMIGYNNKIYCIGGLNNNKCEYYDINQKIWNLFPSLNVNERQFPMLYIYNYYLYAFFGLNYLNENDNDNKNYLDSIERIHINNLERWEFVVYKNPDNLDIKVYGCGIIPCNESSIFLFGGKNNNQILKKVFKYDFKDDTFKKSGFYTDLSFPAYFKENLLHKINNNQYVGISEGKENKGVFVTLP